MYRLKMKNDRYAKKHPVPMSSRNRIFFLYTWIEIPENELKEMFMNYSVTAEKMYVHINTIRKRIDKVNDLVKIDWEDHVDRLKMEILLQFLGL